MTTRAYAADTSSGAPLLSVRDHGTGIAPTVLAKVFEAYTCGMARSRSPRSME